MIRYSFLENITVETLYAAFVAGFADYQVDMRTSLGEFEYRLLRDGVDLSISAGAFCDDELIGFTLNGAGMWLGLPTVYDAGTAVLPEHRGGGIATELFEFLLPRLNELEFNRYLLEVLTSNEAAARLYRKLGFTDARRFAVFRTTDRVTSLKRAEVEIHEAAIPNWKLYQTFWSGYPSWQNSIEAAQRVAGTVVVLEAHIGDRCVGYGVVSKASGNLFQLAVDPSYRRNGVASTLLNALQDRVTGTESIKVNNIDEDMNDTMAFFGAVGFKLALEQHELILTL